MKVISKRIIILVVITLVAATLFTVYAVNSNNVPTTATPACGIADCPNGAACTADANCPSSEACLTGANCTAQNAGNVRYNGNTGCGKNQQPRKMGCGRTV